MIIESRLRQLERTSRQSARQRRCAACKDWPATLISYENDWHDGRTQSDTAPTAPAPPDSSTSPDDSPPDRHCPHCGFRPHRIVVQYVDDWREVVPRTPESW